MNKFIFTLACVIGILIPTQVQAKEVPSACKYSYTGLWTCSYSYGNNRSWNSWNPNSGYSSNGYNSYGSYGRSWGSYNYSTPYGNGYKSYTYSPFSGFDWYTSPIWGDD